MDDSELSYCEIPLEHHIFELQHSFDIGLNRNRYIVYRKDIYIVLHKLVQPLYKKHYLMNILHQMMLFSFFVCTM